jgi:hypothetical protein
MNEVPVPFPDPLDPDDLVVEVVDAARRSPDLTDEERDVAEAIAIRAMQRGTTEAAALAEELEGPDARRIVDEARESIGLPTFEEIERKREIASAGRDDPPTHYHGPPRDFRGRAVQQCAAPGCQALSKDEATGSVGPVAAKRFWCPAHEAEAPGGDMAPWTPPPVRYGIGGGFVDEAQAAADAKHYERLVAESRETAKEAKRNRPIRVRRFEV